MQKPSPLGFGLGPRPAYYQDFLDKKPKVDWFEVISENYLISGGNDRAQHANLNCTETAAASQDEGCLSRDLRHALLPFRFADFIFNRTKPPFCYANAILAGWRRGPPLAFLSKRRFASVRLVGGNCGASLVRSASISWKLRGADLMKSLKEPHSQ